MGFGLIYKKKQTCIVTFSAEFFRMI